jgi:hypothetical protein
MREGIMPGMTIGALIGAAVDGMSGDDGVADGALKGAIAGKAIQIVAPVVITYAVGWLVLRGIGQAFAALSDQMEELR